MKSRLRIMFPEGVFVALFLSCLFDVFSSIAQKYINRTTNMNFARKYISEYKHQYIETKLC